MKVAVFVKGVSERKSMEMENFVRVRWDFAGRYSDEKELLKDARERVIEKQGNSFNVLEKGNFSCLIVEDSNSISSKMEKELYNFYGIEIINFRKQKKIEEENRYAPDSHEKDVGLADSGEYKKVVK